jgi:hypothetical protein
MKVRFDTRLLSYEEQTVKYPTLIAWCILTVTLVISADTGLMNLAVRCI